MLQRVRGLVVGLIVGMLLTAGVAVAAGGIPDGVGVIHGCYKLNGDLYVVPAGTACKKNETALQWSQTGPQGPQGTQGPQGPQGVPGAGGGTVSAKDVFLAIHVCRFCDLRGLQLHGSFSAAGAVYSNGVEAVYSDLRGADLRDADLTRGFVSGSDIRGVDFTGTKMPFLDGTHADSTTLLTGAIFTVGDYCSLISDADWRGVDLHGVTIPHPCIGSSRFDGANFANAIVSDADLTGDVFDGADMSGVNLQAGYFGSDGSFANVDFTGANLSDVNFRTGATVAGSDMTDADLTGMSGNHGVGLVGLDVTGVTWSNTTCPDGTNSNANWGTCVGH